MTDRPHQVQVNNELLKPVEIPEQAPLESTVSSNTNALVGTPKQAPFVDALPLPPLGNQIPASNGAGLSMVVHKQAGQISVEAKGKLVDAIAGAVAAAMKRSFKESRALAMTKALMSVGAFGILGGGMSMKLTFMNSAAGFFEYIMPSPGTLEVLCTVGMFVAAVGIDFYAQKSRRDDERAMWKLALDPAFDGKGKDALIAKLSKSD